MTDKASLARFFEKHPELLPVSEALEAFFSRNTVTSNCYTCAAPLTVIHDNLVEIGVTATYVTCPNGCTNYRASGSKTP